VHARAAGAAFGGVQVQVHAEGWIGVPDGPVAKQVRVLERRSELLAERISRLRQEHSELIHGVREHLDTANAEHGEATLRRAS
jgi:hypothetical protein